MKTMPTPAQNRFVDALFRHGRMLGLLFLFTIVFGTIAFTSLNRQGFPDVLVNIAVVQAPYPNASAEQVEEGVLIPLEEAVAEAEGVKEFESFAADGFGSIVVTFEEDADLKSVLGSLQEDISRISLPEGAEEVTTQEFTTAGVGSFLLAVTGPEHVWDLYTAGKDVQGEIQRIDGVSAVSVKNALTPEILVTFFDDRLAEHQLTRSQVEAVVANAQFQAPAGSLRSEDGTDVFVSIAKQTETLEELRNLLVAPNVRLRDVAAVRTRLNNNQHYNRIGFQTEEDGLTVARALVLEVSLREDADILTVNEELQEVIEELQKEDEREEAINLVMLFSQAEATEEQIEEIRSGLFGRSIDDLGTFSFLGYLLGGVTIVILLLFLFMNWRVAILAALAVPLSLLVTSMYLSLIGIGLNTLVLFAMVLAIGLVVDPTIVYLESMQRYKDQGMTGRAAAAKTMNTVGNGIFLAVLTNILVFVPFGIVSGFFGEIISYIPATIIPAMVASLLIPVLFFVPFASRFLKPRNEKGKETDELTGTWRVSRGVGKVTAWLVAAGTLRSMVRVLVFLVVLSLPVVLIGVFLSTGTVKPVQFSTPGDVEQLVIYGDLNDEWPFEKAVYEVIVPFQDVLAEQEEIENFVYFEQSGNDFTLLVNLLDFETRRERDLRTGSELAKDLNDAIAALELEDAFIEADVSSEGPPQERFPIQVRLFAHDLETLRTASDDIVEYLSGLEGIERVESNARTSGEGSLTLVLDETNAMNLQPALVYGIVARELAETELGTLTFGGEQFTVLTRGADMVERLSELRAVPVPTSMDAENPVTLGDLVKEEQTTESTTIRRANGERFVQIQASVADDADVLALESRLKEYVTDEKVEELGLEQEAVRFEGEANAISDSFTELFYALLIAIFLIYVLLVAFFRSFFEPFLILFAIPLGLVGVFSAVAVLTGQLGFLELLGVVAMAGVVVNVTILLIDYANQLVREGKSVREAIATSVAVRFRPITLTTLTAFGSLFPLMFYSPFWQGLAASIIFGILSSAILSLLLTPILYLWVHQLEETPRKVRDWRQKRKGNKETK